MASGRTDRIVESAGHIVSGIDDMLLLMATFLGPEAMNGLALVNKDVYERLSDRMLCSVLVDGCFGSDQTMLDSLQQKCLAKIEERGISAVLMNEIKSKLREDGSNFFYISSTAPLNKWIHAAIEDGRLAGVERMDAGASILAPSDIEADTQFAKIVRQHFNRHVQFYKKAGTKIDSVDLAETVERALGCDGAYMKLDTSLDVRSVIERSRESTETQPTWW